MDEEEISKELSRFQDMMITSLTQNDVDITKAPCEETVRRLEAIFNETQGKESEEKICEMYAKTYYNLLNYGMLYMEGIERIMQCDDIMFPPDDNLAAFQDRSYDGTSGKPKFKVLPLLKRFINSIAYPYVPKDRKTMDAFREELRHDYAPGDWVPENDQIKECYKRWRERSEWNRFFQRYGYKDKNRMILIVFALQREHQQNIDQNTEQLSWSAGSEQLYNNSTRSISGKQEEKQSVLEVLLLNESRDILSALRRDWDKVVTRLLKRINQADNGVFKEADKNIQEVI